ncbi:MAG: polyprenyl synthetase family protein [Gemmataceae bacterium]
MNTLLPLNTTAPFLPTMQPWDLIDSELQKVESLLSETMSRYDTLFPELIEHLQHYRGKRLRPALVLLTGLASGGITQAHRTLAAVVEMVHTATLVHDDVLDEAQIRRHVRTINAGWGNRVSILFGDMLFSHAFHLSASIDRRACEIIGESTNRVCIGELKQNLESGNYELSEGAYFQIIDGKTAALTECCGRLGALYAGQPASVVESMAIYGRDLGRAFQMADDVLDLTGQEATTGKTLGTDLEQRKLTLPLIHALQQLPNGEAAEFRRALETNALTRSEVLRIVEQAGGILYTRRRADQFLQNAMQQLQSLPESDARRVLEILPEWSLRRSK